MKTGGFCTYILAAFILSCAANTVMAQQAPAPDKSAPAASQDSLSGSTSLTDFIQEQSPDAGEPQKQAAKPDAKENKDQTGGNWLKNAADKLAQKGAKALSGGNDKPAVIHRSNASVFDVAGIMLRMDTAQVSEAMQKRGYKKTAEHMEIPNFIRWRYEEQCRNQGIVGYERIDNCVILLSRKNNYQYVQKMNFNNFLTKESVEVYFTSNFTGNKVYRVMYRTEAANIRGSGAKAEYLRNIKVFDFWKKINQKYGTPDNREEVSWGLGDKKPSLKAATGSLILDDPMLLELDYTRMSREDQKFMNTAVYTF